MSTYTLELDEHDLRMLMHAMKAYRRQLDKNQRRNERIGWTPEPGKGDRQSALMTRWIDLDRRLRASSRPSRTSGPSEPPH